VVWWQADCWQRWHPRWCINLLSGCIRSVTYLLFNWFYIFNHVALETNLKNDFIAQTFHGGGKSLAAAERGDYGKMFWSLTSDLLFTFEKVTVMYFLSIFYVCSSGKLCKFDGISLIAIAVLYMWEIRLRTVRIFTPPAPSPYPTQLKLWKGFLNNSCLRFFSEWTKREPTWLQGWSRRIGSMSGQWSVFISYELYSSEKQNSWCVTVMMKMIKKGRLSSLKCFILSLSLRSFFVMLIKASYRYPLHRKLRL